MVFAAGLGTRLKPYTLEHPKALVTVGGVPMLERVILKLKSDGINDIVVNVHHFASQIIEFIEQNNNFGINITISDESEKLLDTGGGVLKAKKLIDSDEPIVLYNADILSNVDLKAMLVQHCATNADVTLLATVRNTSRYLCFDRNTHNLVGWTNTNTHETRPQGFKLTDKIEMLAFGGVHIISPHVFHLLASYTSEQKFSLTPFYIDSCRKMSIRSFTPVGNFVWFDVGKPETLAPAEAYIKNQS